MGQKKKAYMCFALAANTSLLLMDEPTAGVDIGAKTEIIRIIRSFAKEKKSVLFISSELSEVLAICDRIIVLKNGQIQKTIMRNEIHSEEELQHAVQM